MGGLQWTTLRLDVVGLLAVIGESAMSAHAVIATASRWGLVPRIIPAPQALFRHSRPHRLPSLTQGVTVVGVCSGNAIKELSYFANLLHGIEGLPQYAVGSITIKHKLEQPNHERGHQSDAEKGKGARSTKVCIPLSRLGPVILLSLLGALAALGILILAIVRHDGMAVVAILLISATSSLVGLGSKWTLVLPHRKGKEPVPKPDIMVCGRQGAFLHITCTEEIARELYFGQEECEYMLDTRGFHFLAGASTFMLMAAVISMANCSLVLQYALGITYITMNGLYWLAALLPETWHWQLEDVYDVEYHRLGTPEKPVGENDKDYLGSGTAKRNREDQWLKAYEDYTQALIAAIELAGGAKWVKFAGAPRNAAWRAWLKEADGIWEAEGGEGPEELRRRWKEWNPSKQLAQKLGSFSEGVSRPNTETICRPTQAYTTFDRHGNTSESCFQ
ncbi:hypothetical protein EV426DRAFT_16935 [Tirmania nivea]|nr:hypothetical protein EV426DRAFT_16935 [Tirmania nivea]